MQVTYKGGTLFTAEQRGHTITIDLPPDKGGTDQGMTPPELLAASLGSCIGIYVTQYCKQVGLNCEGTTVDVSWEVTSEPMRIERIHAVVKVPAGIPEERRAAVMRAAEHCLIHRTLCTIPGIKIELA
ncbi:MAG: OsmC family protein [Armatimonadetes bacterium]|nr:OsmC family protein [Armatimonadota bacterium]